MRKTILILCIGISWHCCTVNSFDFMGRGGDYSDTSAIRERENKDFQSGWKNLTSTKMICFTNVSVLGSPPKMAHLWRFGRFPSTRLPKKKKTPPETVSTIVHLYGCNTVFNPSGREQVDADIKLNPICGGTSGLLMHELSFQDRFFKVNASSWDIFHSDFTQTELIPRDRMNQPFESYLTLTYGWRSGKLGNNEGIVKEGVTHNFK